MMSIPVRSGYRETLAINPDGGRLDRKILISYNQLDFLIRRRGESAHREAIELIPMALRKPTAIFEGIRDQGIKGLCYVCLPECRYTGRTDVVSQPRESNRCFCVYVDDDGVIIEWRWDECDGKTGFPLAYETRFVRRAL